MTEQKIKPVKKAKVNTEIKSEVSHTTKKSESSLSKGIISVIRIDGEVKVKPQIANTLNRMRLRKKYSSVLINSDNKSQMGMLWKIRHAVAYGEIEKETLSKLLKARAMPDYSQVDKVKKIMEKIEKNPEEIAGELIEGKNLEELGIKPFFRLHPPRKGINSKLQYPKGVLGNNKKDINKLIERML
jgi:large subunit ribosomal protein L30